MGLDISHDAWHGAYSSFMRYRIKIAEVSGLPDLEKMQGFAENGISWDPYKKHPLHDFLYHSDCDGDIKWSKLSKMADCLESLLPKLEGEEGGGHIGNYADKTRTLVKGMRLAYSKKEKLLFR